MPALPGSGAAGLAGDAAQEKGAGDLEAAGACAVEGLGRSRGGRVRTPVPGTLVRKACCRGEPALSLEGKLPLSSAPCGTPRPVGAGASKAGRAPL